jgi:hypothetical protein
MYLAEPKKPRNKRHPLWSKETLQEELANSSSGITSICKRYAPSDGNWKALYFDTQRWKREDPEFAVLLEDHRKRTDGQKRVNPSGGRQRKDSDPKHSDWRIKFCDELLKTRSRNRAASVTPYSPEEIYMMLNEKYSTYDRDFCDMVHLTEMRMVAWAEEVMWNSLDDAKNPKDKAWIAKEILKVRDRPRWGDKLDIAVGGTIQHILPEQRRQMLIELEGDQRNAFKDTPKELPAGEIIEVEVVKVADAVYS